MLFNCDYSYVIGRSKDYSWPNLKLLGKNDINKAFSLVLLLKPNYKFCIIF